MNKEKNSAKPVDQKAKYFIIRLLFSIFWLSVPLLFLTGANEKYSISLGIITLFVFYSHLNHAIIFRKLIWASKGIKGIVLTLLFGPTELVLIKKQAAEQDQ